MCTISNITTRKRVGYKILARKNSKLYSSFTGQPFGIGKVKKAPKYPKRISGYWTRDLDRAVNYRNGIKDIYVYSPEFDGMTAAFVNINNAKNLFREMMYSAIFDNYILVLVKIVFVNKVLEGNYSNYSIIAGSNVKSIEIIDYGKEM